jgi:hypothetical protein
MNKINEILVGLLICLSIFLQISLISAGNTYLDDGSPTQNVNDCSGAGGLNTTGATYRLTQDVSTPNICFWFEASDITLNCQGHTINYSTDGGDNEPAIVSTVYNSITIKNCNIIQGGIIGNSDKGISFSTDNGIIENNIITTYGNDSYGISLTYANNNNISDTTISTASSDVFLSSSMNNIFLNTTYSTENVSLDSELIRQWYLDVNVNNAVYYLLNANVIGYDKNNNFIFSELTDNNGNIPTQDLTEYIIKKTYSYNIISGLSWAGDLHSTPNVFNLDGNTYLIAGSEGGGGNGYIWNGDLDLDWDSDGGITNGLTGYNYDYSSEGFNLNGFDYLISCGYNGDDGFVWNTTNSIWVSNTTIMTGFGCGGWSNPTVFYMDGFYYLINGNTAGDWTGFVWNGAGWTSNATIISGLSHETYQDSSPTVFYMNSVWYLITGNGHGGFSGYSWDGTQWQSDSTIREGLPIDPQGVESFSIPNVFNLDGNYYLISGKYSGWWNGYVWNGTQWTSGGSEIMTTTYYSNYTINTTLAYYNDSSQSINMSMNRFLNIILAWNGTALPTANFTPMSWEEVNLDENIVNPQNTEQGLLPSVYYGLATFLSNVMTPAIIVIFVVFICLIMVTIGTIIKKIAMRI